MDHLTEQDAGLLEQAASMLEGLANDERNRGNCSSSEGAACSAHAIRRLAPALLRAGRGCLAQIEEPAQPRPWDAADIKQPRWGHVFAAFVEGAKEARANPDADEYIFGRSADAHTKRVLEEIDPVSEHALRTGTWSVETAAVAGPAWDKTRDSLATLLLGLARRPFLDFDVACIALDSATEPGMPLAYMRGAPAAPALEAPAATTGPIAEDLLGAIKRDILGCGPEWREKVICYPDGPAQSWAATIHLPVPVDAADKSAEAALDRWISRLEPGALGIDQLLGALSQHDDPCEDIADALARVHALRAAAAPQAPAAPVVQSQKGGIA
ncbi:hypothetical protein [Delftia acidovorans]|uniref:hypothetical protein n=1 Tax=Delftia acidovorans TaxID=80866 RepID=UPI000BC87FE1|nr:hypothetical protein [Delftia acidovorans]SOE35249.1 hypothetical protein SAMN05216519_1229 [Delftia acidovorans]